MSATTRTPERLAVWCTELELTDRPGGLVPPPGRTTERARVLLRLHGRVLGIVEVPAGPSHLVAEVLLAGLGPAGAARLADELAECVTEGCVEDPAAPLHAHPRLRGEADADAPLVTVVICTRDRADQLVTCLATLRRQDHPAMEVVVVDNAPSDDATQVAFGSAVGDDRRFRYVREDVPGVSAARNRGLAEAHGGIVAYTDDDVHVDSSWVSATARAFAEHPAAACVTSLVCARTLDTPAERFFDDRVSWSLACEPRTYTPLEATEPLHPFAAGAFGTGAGMAFRTSVLRDLGGFDELLGAGTPTRGGEDLDAFARVLLAGHELHYEPSAVVWHSHRADLPSLRKQMLGYGSGLSAYLTKHLLDEHSRRLMLARVPRGVAHYARGARRVVGHEDVATATAPGAPRSTGGIDGATTGGHGLPTTGLLARELAGLAVGPLWYLRAARRRRRDAAPTPPPPPRPPPPAAPAPGRAGRAPVPPPATPEVA
ncbi:glycosyltransferase [Nocardioides bruguierae]|uniref:glycosyltransferase n=1 Tax=Nocardioides bruguierae TaxID=2945102 RepID=UPI002549A951|nr:glycosyltransferase family A protein [Nocardioides bruguierae]